MQMQIGEFRFEIGAAEYQALTRIRARRWAQRERHGRPPALEDMGREAERITLTGTVWVSTSDDLAALDALGTEAGLDAGDDGKLLPVFMGGGGGRSGPFLGRWAVDRLEVEERALRFDGIPAEIGFTVSLIEAADD